MQQTAKQNHLLPKKKQSLQVLTPHSLLSMRSEASSPTFQHTIIQHSIAEMLQFASVLTCCPQESIPPQTCSNLRNYYVYAAAIPVSAANININTDDAESMDVKVPSSTVYSMFPALMCTPVSSKSGSKADDGSPTIPLRTRMSAAVVTATTTPRAFLLRRGLAEAEVFHLLAKSCALDIV